MFPRAERLTHRRAFQALARLGQRIPGRFVELTYLVTRQPPSRIAVVVSTKVDKKAVRRNRMKRKLRVFIKELQVRFKRPVDLACYVKRTIGEEDWPVVELELKRGLAVLLSS